MPTDKEMQFGQDICDALPDYEHNFRDCQYAAKVLMDKGYHKQNEGEWIEHTYITTSDYVIKCSNCKNSFAMKSYQKHYAYCPDCGTKMKVGAEK